MITEQRLRFEAKHKVPFGVYYHQPENAYLNKFANADDWRKAELYNNLWQGYQSALEDRQGEAVCEIKARPGDFRFMYWLKPLSELPVGTLLFTSPQPARPLLTDEEMEYLCETLVDNAMHANTPIEMKGIIETALYHRQLSTNAQPDQSKADAYTKDHAEWDEGGSLGNDIEFARPVSAEVEAAVDAAAQPDYETLRPVITVTNNEGKSAESTITITYPVSAKAIRLEAHNAAIEAAADTAHDAIHEAIYKIDDCEPVKAAVVDAILALRKGA